MKKGVKPTRLLVTTLIDAKSSIRIKTLLLCLLLVTLVLVSACVAGDPVPEPVYFTDVDGADATFETLRLTGQTVSKPPLIIDAGELLTVPRPGTLEYDGTGIYLTNTDHRRFISQAADSIIAAQVVANTIVETTVFNGVLNANELKTHRVYRLSYFGHMDTASAADTVTIRVHINGTTLVTLTSNLGAVADSPFNGDAVFTVREVGAAGELSAYAGALLGSKSIRTNTSSIAIDTTGINNIILTFQWSAAKVDNIMVLDQAFMEVLD